MGRKTRRAEFSVTEPITLDDLRWLVSQTDHMPGTSRVDTKEHRDLGHPTDYDQASITVSGEIPGVNALDPKKITYMPLEQATAVPGDGFWNIMADRWWSHIPEKGLIFYGKSPQCNSNEDLAKALARRIWPDAVVIFLPRVYLKHDCADYR